MERREGKTGCAPIPIAQFRSGTGTKNITQKHRSRCRQNVRHRVKKEKEKKEDHSAKERGKVPGPRLCGEQRNGRNQMEKEREKEQKGEESRGRELPITRQSQEEQKRTEREDEAENGPSGGVDKGRSCMDG